MRKKYLRLVKDGAPGTGLFSYFHSCGHKFHKQCISYRAVMREMMKNLGPKNGHVSHHEHSSVTCRAAALF